MLEDRTVPSAALAWYHYGSSGSATSLVDASGNNFNATATGSTFVPDRPPGADSIPGVPLSAGSLLIDGNAGSGGLTNANHITSLSTVQANGGITYETWLYRNALNNNTSGIQDLLEIESIGLFIRRDTNFVSWTNSEDSSIQTSTSIGIGEWHHIAGVFDCGANTIVNGSLQGSIRFYLDGSLILTAPTRIGPNLDNLSDRPAGIGRHPVAGLDVETFNGELFESRISLGALQPNQLLLPTAPDIAMQSAQLQAGNTVQFTYQTTGDPGPFEVGLYQSVDGTTFDPAAPIPGVPLQIITPSPMNPQAPGSFTLPSSFTPDPSKPFLVVAEDPNNLFAETNEDNNTASILLPDIAMQSARLQAGNTVQFTYQTTGDPGPFEVALCRSADPSFDPSDTVISTQTLTPSPTASQATGTFSLSSIPTTPSQPYLLVVADPPTNSSPHGMILESNENNNVALVYPGSADILGRYLQATFPNADIRVTSSRRTVEQQAALMLEQALNSPQGFLRTYHDAGYAYDMRDYLNTTITPNGRTVRQILEGPPGSLQTQVYNAAITAFSDLIYQALAEGHFVSRHLAGYAIDITIPLSEQDIILSLIQAFGGIVNTHEPGHRPHWHISYIPPG